MPRLEQLYPRYYQCPFPLRFFAFDAELFSVIFFQQVYAETRSTCFLCLFICSMSSFRDILDDRIATDEVLRLHITKKALSRIQILNWLITNDLKKIALFVAKSHYLWINFAIFCVVLQKKNGCILLLFNVKSDFIDLYVAFSTWL